jgi:hypothetical protein
MKFINKIREFFSAIRWYMAGNRIEKCSSNPDYYKSFSKEHESEFKEFKDRNILNEIKESFGFFNGYFRNNEASTIIRSMNEHERLYRNRYSNGWYSHGELSYKPYFRREQSPKYLALYFYLIALNMDDVDFYPSNLGYDDMSRPFNASSMRNEPCNLDLVIGKYSVTSDCKVNIK